MFYIPPIKYFRPEEFFSPIIVKKHINKNGNIMSHIWRLIDSRVTWTAVQLRKEFGTMTINDYLWNGNNKQRGYRDPIELIDLLHYKQTGEITTLFSSFTSQHCLGQGLDSKFKKVLAEEARQYIIKYSDKESFKYITAIEKEVSWLHFDVRNFKIGTKRFFIF